MLSRNLKIKGATLLSVEEAENLLTVKDRIYANCWWWLRSPGDYSSSAAVVSNDGDVRYYGDLVNYDSHCVRPALRIQDLQSSNLQIGDTFKVGDWKFRVISEELAWMYEQDIGQRRFDARSNIYRISEIKQFTNAWFEREIKPFVQEVTKICKKK